MVARTAILKRVYYWACIASSAACAALWIQLLCRPANEPGRDLAALGYIFGAYGSLERAIRLRQESE